MGLNGQAGEHSWQFNARRDSNSQFGTSHTEFAGYGWRFSPQWRLHGSYGTTFVAPSFNDLYYPGSSNPSLRPEYGSNRDLGLAWSAGGHNIKVIHFDNRMRDMIVWSGSAPVNVGRARMEGWTLGYEGRIERVSVRASLEALDPRNQLDGTKLPRRSGNQSTLAAEWPLGDWRLGVSMLHIGSRFDDAANTLPLTAYTVTDLFVPEAMSCPTITDWIVTTPSDPAPIYRFSGSALYAGGFGAIALGNARGMLDTFIHIARDKTPRGAKNALRDSPVVQMQVALADTQLRAARTFLIQSLREVQEGIRATGAITTDQRMTIRAAGTNAIHRGTEVVETLYRAAGATAIFETEPFERRFRDAYSVSQHLQGRLAHFEQIGKHLLGQETDLMFV